MTSHVEEVIRAAFDPQDFDPGRNLLDYAATYTRDDVTWLRDVRKWTDLSDENLKASGPLTQNLLARMYGDMYQAFLPAWMLSSIGAPVDSPILEPTLCTLDPKSSAAAFGLEAFEARTASLTSKQAAAISVFAECFVGSRELEELFGEGIAERVRDYWAKRAQAMLSPS